MVINTTAGLLRVDQEFLVVSQSMGARPLKVFFKVRLPGALPYFFEGLKISIMLAVVSAVVGEFVGADRGLGYVLLSATARLDTTLAFATILLMSALGMALYGLVELTERVVVPWRRDLRLATTTTATRESL